MTYELNREKLADYLVNEKNTEDAIEIVEKERKKDDSKTLDSEALIIVKTLATEDWKEALVEEWYGDELVTQWKERPDYKEFRERRLDEMKQDVEAPEALEAAVQERVRSQLEKLTQRKKGHNLTFGLELEVFATRGQKDKEEQAKKIDALEKIGIPIGKDALREIELPYSKGAHEQLAATKDLAEIGMIKEEQRVGVHLNVGGLVEFDENVFLLDQLIHAANLFNEPIVEGTILETAQPKPLYSDERWEQCYGLPFVVKNAGKKYDNLVIEFRGLPEIGNSEEHTQPGQIAHRSAKYSSYSKGVLNTELLLETIAGFQKVELQGFTDEKDLVLHDTWTTLKEATLTEFEDWGIPREDTYTMRYTENQEQVNAYYEHLANIRDKVANDKHNETNEKRRAKMYRHVLDARQKISEIFVGE